MTKQILILLSLLLIQPAFATDDIIIEEGLKAFEKTLYPALRESCVKCHGDGGIAIGHSVSNSREAYLNSKQLVDFASIESSRFVAKVRAKHWLRYDPNVTGMEVEQMLTYLRAWWEAGESKANAKFDVVGTKVLLPDTLPEMKDGKFVTLNWDLIRIGSAMELPGCSASVEVQRAKHPSETSPGSYRVRNPKMKCRGQDIEVQSLYFAVSDEIKQFENIYSNVKMMLPKSGEEMTLSPEIMILIQRQPKDWLTILIRKASVKN